jgi:hypothetical protein
MPTLYHGTAPLLAEQIRRGGLSPGDDGYVHLAGSEGLAWADSARSAGLCMAEGLIESPAWHGPLLPRAVLVLMGWPV